MIMEKPKAWHPCSQEHGFCPSMEQRVKFPGEKGYGFFALMVIERSGPEKRAHEKLKGVMYKSEPKDQGLMMNFCSFCGEKIDWFRKESQEIKPTDTEDVQHDIQAQ
jgi:hypothetical protein